MMKLWLISQSENDGYDTFDSAVVAAETAGEAKAMHPYERAWPDWRDQPYPCWANDPSSVRAAEIGMAANGVSGVICSSFNAG